MGKSYISKQTFFNYIQKGRALMKMYRVVPQTKRVYSTKNPFPSTCPTLEISIMVIKTENYWYFLAMCHSEIDE